MTALWKGDIALPDGLSHSVLETVELLSNTSPSNASSANDHLLAGAQLRIQAVVDAAKVPLWLSCGPSLDVQTESEATALFFANIFVQQPSPIDEDDCEEEEEGEDAIQVRTECRPTKKALVVRVLYDEPLEETEKPNITELVLYGTLAAEAPPPEPTSDDPHTPALALSVYALPLSSRLAKEKKLHASIKHEPLEPGKAKFLVPIIGRKRKADTIFDEYDKKQAYYASLPPGLRRSWHRRSDSFGSLKEEADSGALGDSQKALPSRSVGPASQNEFRRTVSGEDTTFRRDREPSQSVLHARLREAADRPSTASDVSRREPSGKTALLGSDLRRSESFGGGLRTRNRTPDIKSEFAASLPALATSTSTTAAASSKITERNKTAATRIIMASMRLYGFQRARPQEPRTESDEELEDEYKTVFHATLRAASCSLRRSWNAEVIGVTKLKEVTEYLMKAFVGGAGLTNGSSDQEPEDERQDDNPFRKSTIRRGGGRRFAAPAGALFGEDSLLEESGMA
ncbi:hypothetical protein DRE_06640 [Drechslerella stenobrocha 248]|uniref:Sld7 C-terminal domain-containing protein n=1 Tax=Drechslerella stenobrocha 248 TaxID=1043628 RepID=W7HN65_9PEZI|nr:hypothetical protein DRE_06640 [Drechslerella stenobrocha 248]